MSGSKPNNLLGSRDYLDVGAVLGSPLFGKPLADARPSLSGNFTESDPCRVVKHFEANVSTRPRVSHGEVASDDMPGIATIRPINKCNGGRAAAP